MALLRNPSLINSEILGYCNCLMDFQEFWRKLYAELKHNHNFKTKSQEKSFQANLRDPSTIVVIPTTDDSRPIPIEQFQGMWNIMKNDVRSERYVNTNKRYYSFWSSSYISALIDHIVADQKME